MFEPLHRISLTGAICPFPPSAHITHCHAALALRTAFQIPQLAHPPCIHVSLQAAPGQPAATGSFSPARVVGKPLQREGSARHQAVPKTLAVPTQMNKTCPSPPLQMKVQMEEQWWPVPGVPSKHRHNHLQGQSHSPQQCFSRPTSQGLTELPRDSQQRAGSCLSHLSGM